MFFGIPAPEGVTTYWGARAIYHPNSKDYPIELLSDRQSWEGKESDIERLSAWLNKTGLPRLRKRLGKNGPSTQDTVQHSLTVGAYTVVFNAKGSFGYLYIGAWKTPKVPA